MRRALLCLVLLAAVWAPAAHAALPAHWVKGFDYTAWWHDAYASSDAAASLDGLAGTGANAVGIIATWYQDGMTADAIAPDPDRTPSDASLATAVRRAHARGLRVLLRPVVDPADGGWRGDFRPTSPAAWFASYRRMLVHYARLARRLHVEMLQVGVEYASLSGPGYAGRWRALIRAARARYRGPLTYAANWDEYRRIDWWKALDAIGIDAYFPLTTGGDPSVRALAAAWRRRGYVHDIAAVHRRFHRPVLFTELGYPSASDALATPWAPGGSYAALPQERGLAAAMRVWSRMRWFRGMYLWQWRADGQGGGTGDTDHTVQGKPALATISRWYGGTRPHRHRRRS